ncbi:MAG TPA: hypothetical protein VI282_12605, partial [Verrucomicrobiae bacterium]
MKGNITGLFVLVILAFSAIERSFALDQDVAIRASWPPTSSGQPIRGLAAHIGYLFSISGYYRIERYDFTDPANPRELTAIPSDGLPIALTIEGNRLYVLDTL